MHSEFNDPHDTVRKHRLQLENFKNHQDISERNKELVLDFLRDAALGKTNQRRGRSRIGLPQQTKHLRLLKRYILWIAKDVDKVTLPEMEGFVTALESGAIYALPRGFQKPGSEKNRTHPKTPLAESTQSMIKISVRMFYKWLNGDPKNFPPLVDWIDTYVDKFPEYPALRPRQVEVLHDHAKTPEEHAYVQCFYDGGYRPGELMNIRLNTTQLRSIKVGSKTWSCFAGRTLFSKTFPRTVVLYMPDSTKWLQYWLDAHPARPTIEEDGAIYSRDERALLFPRDYRNMKKLLERLGQRALKQNVWPTLMRHTSATYWCSRLTHYQMCKRFGWAFSSKMPQTYIDREGVDESRIAASYYGGEVEPSFASVHETGLPASPVNVNEVKPEVQARTEHSTLLQELSSLRAELEEIKKKGLTGELSLPARKS